MCGGLVTTVPYVTFPCLNLNTLKMKVSVVKYKMIVLSRNEALFNIVKLI